MMFKSVLSMVATLLAATVSAKSADANGAVSGVRMAKKEASVAMVNQTITPADGWQLFQFTNVGYNSSTRFIINNTVPVIVQYTDLYYVGDSFYMYVNDGPGASGKWMGMNSTALSTTNATFAFLNGSWSTGCLVLASVPPGGSPNSIVLGANESPFTGGAAALRVLNGSSC